MAFFKGIIKLSEEQYQILKTNGTITTQQGVFSYDDNYLYVTDKNDSVTRLKIADELPSVGVSNTIYMILKDDSTNVYDRYIYVNDRFELIGDTNIELTDYAKKSDIPVSLPASDVHSWAKKSTKPSYNLSEINTTQDSLELGNNANINPLYYSIVRNISDNIHQLLITITDDGSIKISHRDKSINSNLDDFFIELGSNKLKYGTNDILTINNGYTKKEIDDKLEELRELINKQ